MKAAGRAEAQLREQACGLAHANRLALLQCKGRATEARRPQRKRQKRKRKKKPRQPKAAAAARGSGSSWWGAGCSSAGSAGGGGSAAPMALGPGGGMLGLLG